MPGTSASSETPFTMHKLFGWILIFFGTTFPLVGTASLKNIALGKSYQLEPAPNYQYCTDSGDFNQLTDNQRVTGLFWTQAGCVGWAGHSPVVITIDLQTNQPIAGVSFSTAAASVSGVSWPAEILIWVSDDKKAWHVAGELVSLSAKQSLPPSVSENKSHRFETHDLQTHGRYVRVIVVPTESYVFADEIEIFRGEDEWLKKPLSGPIKTAIPKITPATRLDSLMHRRLSADFTTIRDNLFHLPLSKTEHLKLNTEIQKLAAEIPSTRIKDATTFTTILPLNETHQRIFQWQAVTWRKQGIKGVVAWPARKWDMLGPTASPLKENPTLDIRMMKNEFRSAAFNVSNAEKNAAFLKLTFEGLPPSLFKAITVHEVPFTDTISGVPVAAALPEVKRSGNTVHIEIPSGMTRQIWLTVHSKDLMPGDYSGRVVIKNSAFRKTTIPLRIKIYPIDFPDQPTLHLGGWDYTDSDHVYQVTPKNRLQLIRHLREHYVDTPWAQTSVMPTGKYDTTGKMTVAPDSSNFREWVKLWPGSRNYFVFSSVTETFAGFPMGTPAFHTALTTWINWWADELQQLQISPTQVGLLLVDEPREAQHDKIVIEYAKVIRAANRGFPIFEDPIWNGPWKGNPQMYELSHILCPNLPMCIEHGSKYLNFYLKQRDSGRRLWFYSCHGPGKLLDPYSYHRMQQWFCWKHGAEGAGFWAFGDSNGASSWNEYLTSAGAFTPLFLDSETVTAGKHMEAIREGIEDYEYLRILRDRIETLEKNGIKNEKLTSALHLLNTAAERVTAPMTSVGQIYWSADKDRDVADNVRLEILEALDNLH